MKLRVRKPFDPSILGRIVKNNPEYGEKHIADEVLEREDYHGGDESTKSISNSINPSMDRDDDLLNIDGSIMDVINELDMDGNKGSEETQWNAVQAVNLWKPSNSRYYQTEFHRFIIRFGMDRTKLVSLHDHDEWNIKRLMFRQYERKPLSHYRCSRVRDKVILMLDNSDSMRWWASNLRILSGLALRFKDVELYIAPNGWIEEKIINRKTVYVNHYDVIGELRGRRIIYVGDYDGADTPIMLSWRNDVIWICPEEKYRRFKSHNWVTYSEKDFKGVFIRAYTLEEMFRCLKMVTRFNNLWIDPHRGEKFLDDRLTEG